MWRPFTNCSNNIHTQDYHSVGRTTFFRQIHSQKNTKKKSKKNPTHVKNKFRVSNQQCLVVFNQFNHPRDKAPVSGDGTSAISKYAVVKCCLRQVTDPSVTTGGSIPLQPVLLQINTKPTHTASILSATAPAAEQSQFTLTNKNHVVFLHCQRYAGKKKWMKVLTN